MGQASDPRFGHCIDCRDDDHQACTTTSCRCRETKEHKDAVAGPTNDTNDVPLPEGFAWEEPPPSRGRHPLTPEKQILLKTQPGKFARIKHYGGRNSAYQVVKNFNLGKFRDLDRTCWEFRDVKDGVHGPGSDLYVAYIGGE